MIAAFAPACASGGPSPRHPSSGHKHHGENVYVAEKGDTLEDVARKFETTVEALKKENGLTRNKLSRGQIIKIPNTSSASTFLPPNHARDEEGEGQVKRPRVKEMAPSASNPKISLHLAWPIENGVVSSEFGIRKNGKHDGIDITAPEGTKIVSSADGTVIFSGEGPTGYGKIVVIKHEENVVTIYAHNSKNIAVKGRSVKQGDVVALVGHTGRATGSHCHFEVRINRVARDPLAYLPKK